jgi:hypothetical protein
VSGFSALFRQLINAHDLILSEMPFFKEGLDDGFDRNQLDRVRVRVRRRHVRHPS